MLTKELTIAAYDFSKGRLVPDRLTRVSHRQYLRHADRMLRVYQTGLGRTRRQLHRAVHDVLSYEPDCPSRRIDAFCKLLDDASQFQRDRQGKAAALRRRVFRLAAQKHPLVSRTDGLFETEEKTVKADVARQLGRTWEEIDGELFSDIIEFHRLVRFDGFTDAAALLARYNVAQVQAALFGAESMTVWARKDFKTILRYAKLARLMHTIARTEDGQYRIRFDGPASVLRGTRRYGVAMARFLPALIACADWRMHAVVQGRAAWKLSLDLCSDDGLSSHLPRPAEFDSSVEASFAEKWGAEPRDGWRLDREGEILHHGQKAFVPDFVFRHEDSRTVLMEIVGYWTPEYLAAKLKTLDAFRDQRILLAVAESLSDRLPSPLPNAITYKSRLKISAVLQALDAMTGTRP
jgi:predicted nuclease of restriction endonuclease-like RecB superfamily